MFKRYEQLLFNLNSPFEIHNGVIWTLYNKMVQPLGPVNVKYSLPKDRAVDILNNVGGILIRWTDGIGECMSGSWYAVICDKFSDIDELSANTRSKIRRGLRSNEVKRIDARYLMNYGYEVYTSAFKRYKKKPEYSEHKFKKMINAYRQFDDIIHIWGIFNNHELVGFSINHVFDKIESNYYMVIFNHEYFRKYISYALYYEMNKYYLRERGFQYVNEGFRNIMHKTEIYDLLQNKFYFKKAYTNLYVMYKPYFKFMIKSMSPFRFILAKIDPRIDAVYYQESISKNY